MLLANGSPTIRNTTVQHTTLHTATLSHCNILPSQYITITTFSHHNIMTWRHIDITTYCHLDTLTLQHFATWTIRHHNIIPHKHSLPLKHYAISEQIKDNVPPLQYATKHFAIKTFFYPDIFATPDIILPMICHSENLQAIKLFYCVGDWWCRITPRVMVDPILLIV